MQLNVDLSQRVVINTNEIPWVDSPMAGVQRRMLERDGDEVARATTIVRYAPGSSFSSHTHGGGEEYLVLEGVFSDEHGDYPVGTYVRNPVGSSHTPFSKEGGTILVKLWQMSPEDQSQTTVKCGFGDCSGEQLPQKAIATVNNSHNSWHPGLVAGLEVMPLHSYKTENVALVKWHPGTFFQGHSHYGGEEIYVIEGTFEDEQGTYPQGTWIRNPHGSVHTPFSKEGCLIYVKTGHLS